MTVRKICHLRVAATHWIYKIRCKVSFEYDCDARAGRQRLRVPLFRDSAVLTLVGFVLQLDALGLESTCRLDVFARLEEYFERCEQPRPSRARVPVVTR